MPDLATLGLEVTSAPVERGAQSLERLSSAAHKAEAAARGVTSATGSSAAAAQRAQAAVSGHTTALAKNTAAAKANEMANKAQAAAARAVMFQQRQLSFQLIDIGQALATAPTMGIYALQNLGFQVAQIGQMYMGNGGFNQAVKDASAQLATFARWTGTIATRFAPLIALVGAGAAAWALFGRRVDESSAYVRELASEAASLDTVKSSISGLQSITDDYARAISGTARAQTIASNSIIADTKREFEAKRSLLELELKRQQALVETNRIALRERQAEARRLLEAATGTIDLDLAGQGVYDPRIGQFARSRAQGAALESMFRVLDSGLGDELKKLRAELTLSEVAANRLQDALSVTFEESVAISQGRIATRGGSSAAEKLMDRYRRIVLDQHQYIAGLNAERDALGQAASATRAAMIEMELLNKAADAGIELTPRMARELHELAAASAEAEFGLAAAEARMRGFEQAGQTMGSVLRGLIDGTLDWRDALFEAAKVALKVMNDINMAQGGAGIFGGGFLQSFMGGLLGIQFASGGYTGPGPKYRPAGIVHAGEYVMTAEATSRIGVRNLDALNYGYARGGYVTPDLLYMRNPANQNVALGQQGRADSDRGAVIVNATFNLSGRRDIEELRRSQGQIESMLARAVVRGRRNQ